MTVLNLRYPDTQLMRLAIESQSNVHSLDDVSVNLPSSYMPALSAPYSVQGSKRDGHGPLGLPEANRLDTEYWMRQLPWRIAKHKQIKTNCRVKMYADDALYSG